jgi:F-type H+-transporting ATPase subunit b
MTSLLLAAEGNPVAAELVPLVTTLVVFVVAFLILKASVWPKITHGLDERERKILGEISAAEEARQQANTALREYEESLAAARKEAAEMINSAKANAKAAADELRERNEAELADMKQRAARDIDAAKRAAIDEIHAEATTLAAAIAGKILQREISVDDQQRLIVESLRELQPARNT